MNAGVIVGPLMASWWTTNWRTSGLTRNLLAGAAFTGGGGCCRANVVAGEMATDVANGGVGGGGADTVAPAIGSAVAVTCTGSMAGGDVGAAETAFGTGGAGACARTAGVANILGGAEVADGDEGGPP